MPALLFLAGYSKVSRRKNGNTSLNHQAQLLATSTGYFEVYHAFVTKIGLYGAGRSKTTFQTLGFTVAGFEPPRLLLK